MMLNLLKAWIVCQLFANCVESADNIVYTRYGPIKGSVLKSRNNRNFYAFRGIPYAQPPVGNLRFAPPVPPTPWQDVRPAIADGNMCIQKNYLIYNNPPVEGNEDCLYINVYTPKLPVRDDPKKRLLPVMVYIHYGGFFAGSGNSDVTGPEFLLDKDIVLVSFNYRLGVFGFLSTNDDSAPGNWALKDQTAALNWVKDNIEFFGGHSKKVTIFGQSAGSVSVHYHIISPSSANLFQNAISESGTALSIWANLQGDFHLQVTRQQAEYVGCNPNDTTVAMIDCLRNVDAFNLTDSIQKFKFFGPEPFVIYSPVIEKLSESNPEPFITQSPVDIIKSGKFNKVPWILGVVSSEGLLRASPLLRQPAQRKELNDKFSTLLPILLGMSASVDTEDLSETWQNITNFFLNGDNFVDIYNPKRVQGFIDLYSDRMITYAAYETALLHNSMGHTPIWFYNFDYRGCQSYGDLFAATTDNIPFKWGTSHCDDLLYLFTAKRFFPDFPKNPNDATMIDVMVNLWTNFAIYGNPTPVTDVAKEPKWPPISNGPHKICSNSLLHLHVSGSYQPNFGERPVKLIIEDNFYSDRMEFWESLPLKENLN